MESSEIKIGDLVEPYRHYEYDETKPAILKSGPYSEDAGTKWRFLGFSIYKDKDKKYELDSLIERLKQETERLQQHVDFELDFDELIELLELDKELDEEPIVELELVEGIFRHKALSQEPEPRIYEKEELPGYIRQMSNSLWYRRCFPDASPHQQFFDEWRKVA